MFCTSDERLCAHCPLICCSALIVFTVFLIDPQMSRVAMISCVLLYRSSACCCCCCCCSTLSAYRIYWPTKGLLLFWACRFTVAADCKQSTPVACLHLTAAVTVTERGCISVAHLYTLKLNKCLNHPQQTLY